MDMLARARTLQQTLQQTLEVEKKLCELKEE